MSKQGGYQIIDISGYALDPNEPTPVVIPGIYSTIESTRKPILISGLSINDTEFSDLFTLFYSNASTFNGEIRIAAQPFIMEVNADDEVTLTPVT